MFSSLTAGESDNHHSARPLDFDLSPSQQVHPQSFIGDNIPIISGDVYRDLYRGSFGEFGRNVRIWGLTHDNALAVDALLEGS